MRIGTRLSRRAIKSTKLTVGVTNIGGIEVTIYIEISCATVLAAANAISEFAERWQVVRCKQSDSIFKSEALTGFYLLCGSNQILIVRKVHERVLRRTAPPNVTNRITLTNALVVKNAAF